MYTVTSNPLPPMLGTITGGVVQSQKSKMRLPTAEAGPPIGVDGGPLVSSARPSEIRPILGVIRVIAFSVTPVDACPVVEVPFTHAL